MFSLPLSMKSWKLCWLVTKEKKSVTYRMHHTYSQCSLNEQVKPPPLITSECIAMGPHWKHAFLCCTTTLFFSGGKGKMARNVIRKIGCQTRQSCWSVVKTTHVWRGPLYWKLMWFWLSPTFFLKIHWAYTCISQLLKERSHLLCLPVTLDGWAVNSGQISILWNSMQALIDDKRSIPRFSDTSSKTNTSRLHPLSLQYIKVFSVFLFNNLLKIQNL